MGMSTRVIAFRDMDGEFQKMLQIKLFCEQQDVSYPKEVQDYFGRYVYENEEDVRQQFLTVDIGLALTEWRSDDAQGYEVNVSKLPTEVKMIRFYNSW